MKEKWPMKSQETGSWCGPACVQEVLRNLLKKEVSQKDLAELMKTTLEDGTTHEQMLKGIKCFGLNAYATTETSLDVLNLVVKTGSVVIINWMSGKDIKEDGHYSILESSGKETVEINNPGYPIWNNGERGSYNTLRRQDFEANWFDVEKNEKTVRNWALIVSVV